MLERKVYSQLLEWKRTHRNKCLMVKGAMQAGKTYIVRHFGKNEYKSFINGNIGVIDGKTTLPHYMVIYI